MMSETSHPRAELVAFIAASVGDQVGDELLVSIARRLKLNPESFTLDQALLVMEQVAHEPGLVGIAGRFAKTRVILAWGAAKR
jgi:hypothetical protein